MGDGGPLGIPAEGQAGRQKSEGAVPGRGQGWADPFRSCWWGRAVGWAWGRGGLSPGDLRSTGRVRPWGEAQTRSERRE